MELTRAAIRTLTHIFNKAVTELSRGEAGTVGYAGALEAVQRVALTIGTLEALVQDQAHKSDLAGLDLEARLAVAGPVPVDQERDLTDDGVFAPEEPEEELVPLIGEE